MAENIAAQKDLEDIIARVREGRKGDLDLMQVMSIAELVLESVQSFFKSVDKTLISEVRSIGSYISNARQEISMLQPNDLQQRRIPEAGRELDEIVNATENATHTIMGAAEDIMELDNSDAEEYQIKVQDAVMKIFEACSFQDITGQRITKVVETLQHIETRVSRFNDALGVCDHSGPADEEEEKREQRRKDLLLNGPASEDEGIAQNDVDELMSSAAETAGDAGASQQDIDALFD